jgi:hypothetical protein
VIAAGAWAGPRAIGTGQRQELVDRPLIVDVPAVVDVPAILAREDAAVARPPVPLPVPSGCRLPVPRLPRGAGHALELARAAAPGSPAPRLPGSPAPRLPRRPRRPRRPARRARGAGGSGCPRGAGHSLALSGHLLAASARHTILAILQCQGRDPAIHATHNPAIRRSATHWRDACFDTWLCPALRVLSSSRRTQSITAPGEATGTPSSSIATRLESSSWHFSESTRRSSASRSTRIA